MDLPPPAYLQQSTTNNKKSDNRMKRHPELQPYVPSDRDRTTSLVVRKGPIGNNSSTSSNRQPKACSSLTSSLTSNTNTTTSTNHTSSNTFRATAPNSIKANKDAKPPALRQTTASRTKTMQQQQHQQQHVPKQLTKTTTPASITTSATKQTTPAPRPASIAAVSSPAIEPIASKLSNSLSSNNNSNTDSTTNDSAINEIDANNVNIINTTNDINTINTTNDINTINTTNDINTDNNINPNETVTNDTVSINERLYQSANSDLSHRNAKEEDVSTNGDFHENHESLFNDLEANLIAEGIVKTEPVTPKLSMSIVSDRGQESYRRESTPDMKASRPLDDKLEMLFKKDEEKRLKAEEELQENARRIEEERQSRQSLIESILSKVNQSS